MSASLSGPEGGIVLLLVLAFIREALSFISSYVAKVGMFGLLPVMIVNAVSFFASAISEMFIKIENESIQKGEEKESFFTSFKQGLKFIKELPEFIMIIGVAIIANFALSPIFSVALPVVFLKDFGLSEEYIQELMKLAEEKRKKSVDLFEFTHCVNQNYSREDKIKVVEMLWRIIYADGKLDQYEDHLVHRLSTLLRLTHKELITAKLSVLSQVKEGKGA